MSGLCLHEPSDEVEELRRQLDDALEMLRAIRAGEVDAVVANADAEDGVFVRAGSDRPYRLFFDAMADGALTLSRGGTVLFANPRIEEMTRVPRTRLIGADVATLFTEGSRREVQALLEAGRAGTVELEISAPGRGPIAVSVTGNTLDLDGQPALCLVVTDVSARNDADAARRFQAGLLDAAGEAIIATDPHGTIIYANPAAERLYGREPGEFLGRRVTETTPGEDFVEQAHEIMATLRSGRGWSGEFVVRRKDGTRFPAFVSDTPVFDGGELVAVIGVSTDISERKAAQEAVAASELRFKTLVRNSGDLFAITTADAVITYVDGPVESLLGVDKDVLVGTDLFSLIQPEDLPTALERWERLLVSTAPMPPDEYWTRRADGRWMYLSIVSTNLLDDPDLPGIVVTARDITDHQRLVMARQALGDANKALVRAENEADLLSGICDVVVRERAYDSVWVGITDSTAPLGVRRVASSGATSYVDALEAMMTDADDRGPLGRAQESHEIQIVQDVSALPDTMPWKTLALDHGYQSVIALPLGNGADLGVLSIYAREPFTFSDDAVTVLKELASDVSFGIRSLRTRTERADYQSRFESSLEAAVRAVATAAELRDAYTAGHQRRVAQLASAIAEALEVDPALVPGIAVAASIHDIGKLAVPAEILSRPGQLSDAEFALIKNHPEAGSAIVEGIDFPWPIAEMILQHHERLDGSGYPRGLRGGEIGLGARIIAVADTVEAVQSHRPYRPALGGVDTAMDIIADERGVRLDPDAVDACIGLFRERGFHFVD